MFFLSLRVHKMTLNSADLNLEINLDSAPTLKKKGGGAGSIWYRGSLDYIRLQCRDCVAHGMSQHRAKSIILA